VNGSNVCLFCREIPQYSLFVRTDTSTQPSWNTERWYRCFLLRLLGGCGRARLLQEQEPMRPAMYCGLSVSYGSAGREDVSHPVFVCCSVLHRHQANRDSRKLRPDACQTHPNRNLNLFKVGLVTVVCLVKNNRLTV
jgi:hypothetical protein